MSVTRPTSEVNSSVLLAMAASRPLDFSSRILVSSAERLPTAAAISSARPTKLRATSALTPSRVRSTSPAFCLSTLLTPVEREVSARSTSPAVERIDSLEVEAAPIMARSTFDAVAVSVRSTSLAVPRIVSLVADAAPEMVRSASPALERIAWVA